MCHACLPPWAYVCVCVCEQCMWCVWVFFLPAHAHEYHISRSTHITNDTFAGVSVYLHFEITQNGSASTTYRLAWAKRLSFIIISVDRFETYYHICRRYVSYTGTVGRLLLLLVCSFLLLLFSVLPCYTHRMPRNKVKTTQIEIKIAGFRRFCRPMQRFRSNSSRMLPCRPR